ncbi:MAG: type II secretion system GspH family protein [Agarilytica sp.]
MPRRHLGFTLIELVAVLVLIGILGTTITTAVMPSDTFQMQSSRDQVVTAFFSAQQRAMAQTSPVSLVLSSPNTVDVRQSGASIRVGGVQYPITLLPNQTLSASTIAFDRLGRTSAVDLTLSQNGDSVTISVSSTGYIN